MVLVKILPFKTMLVMAFSTGAATSSQETQNQSVVFALTHLQRLLMDGGERHYQMVLAQLKVVLKLPWAFSVPLRAAHKGAVQGVDRVEHHVLIPVESKASFNKVERIIIK